MTRDEWVQKRSLTQARTHNQRIVRGEGALLTRRALDTARTRANWEARVMVHYGYHPGTHTTHLTQDMTRDLPDPNGTPLDWLLAWEAVETRRSQYI